MKANQDSNDSENKIQQINGKKLRLMLNTALKNLKEKEEYINSLNVFPVPDGDTGTNMYHTFRAAVEEVKDLDSSEVAQITSSLAQGALMGARGNSGVILSQLLRGFSEKNKNNVHLKPEKLVSSLKNAASVAYQGVMKPVEGTILTVASKAAKGAEKAFQNELDIGNIMQNTVEYAQQALEKTPEQLSALNEAGVVDAGGQGYLIILKGMLAGLDIDKSNLEQKDEINSTLNLISESEEDKRTDVTHSESETNLSYTYDTQALININEQNLNLDKIRQELDKFGDSLIVVGSDKTVKIHIHTNHPGIVLEQALDWGSLKDIVIENMQEQANRKQAGENSESFNDNLTENKTRRAVISVAQGTGFHKILNDLGVDRVISGGNTNNPSTSDFVEVIEELPVKEIVILPNNDNIISAARQAKSIVEKKVIVLETSSIPEAISALMVYDEETELKDLKKQMAQEAKIPHTLQVTKAIKDSRVNGFDIKEGDILGLYDGEIVCRENDNPAVIKKLFAEYYQGEELITIYYGQEVNDNQAKETKEMLQKEYSSADFEIYQGGQPVYSYIISLE